MWIYYIYIYIYIYIRYHKAKYASIYLIFWGDTPKRSDEETRGFFSGRKARAIRSGETPQKSLILPPVHTFMKDLVTPLNLMFS